MSARIAARFIQLGVLQLVLGSFGGALIARSASPSLAVSIHVGVLLNAATMIGIGVIWERLSLGPTAERAAFWLLVYGALTNWAIGTVAALVGIGGTTFTLAGADAIGTPFEETVMRYAMMSMVGSLAVGVSIVAWGVRKIHEGTEPL